MKEKTILAEKKFIRDYCSEKKLKKEDLLKLLGEVHREFNIVSENSLQEIAKELSLHPSEVDSVCSFYSFYEKERGDYSIKLCKTIMCQLKGKEEVAKKLEEELKIKFGEVSRNKKYSLSYSNCLGMCDKGPALLINDILIPKVTEDKVEDIIVSIENGDFLEKYGVGEISDVNCEDIILENSEDIILENSEEVDNSLKKLLLKSPESLLNLIKISGLKGRGGAGFPTYLKWELVKNHSENKKFVVCNADEGEPGTFKDRYLLERECQRLLEAMTVAGHIIGAEKAYIYLRNEYSYLKEQIEENIRKRRAKKLLGENIANLGKNFDIELVLGGGAYICGEETALIESLEGHRGEPRNRPPYPVDTGFKNSPTIVNNVETFLDVLLVLEEGADIFNSLGTEKSKGTKLFSVSGDCEKEGIYEFPFGITIKELLEKVGAKKTKGVQIGGASGRCIGKKEFSKIIAYESLSTGGSIMIFNEDRKMLDIAENFMEFFVEESCGQCTPCREGNLVLLDCIRDLKKNRVSRKYLERVVRLTETMRNSSKCGLGQSSSNAFVSIVENFREEIEEYLLKGEN